MEKFQGFGLDIFHSIHLGDILKILILYPIITNIHT